MMTATRGIFTIGVELGMEFRNQELEVATDLIYFNSITKPAERAASASRELDDVGEISPREPLCDAVAFFRQTAAQIPRMAVRTRPAGVASSAMPESFKAGGAGRAIGASSGTAFGI